MRSAMPVVEMFAAHSFHRPDTVFPSGYGIVVRHNGNVIHRECGVVSISADRVHAKQEWIRKTFVVLNELGKHFAPRRLILAIHDRSSYQKILSALRARTPKWWSPLAIPWKIVAAQPFGVEVVLVESRLNPAREEATKGMWEARRAFADLAANGINVREEVKVTRKEMVYAEG